MIIEILLKDKIDLTKIFQVKLKKNINMIEDLNMEIKKEDKDNHMDKNGN